MAIDDDLMHVTQNAPLAELRDGIDNAFRGEPLVETYQVSVPSDDGDEKQLTIELQILPISSENAAAIEHAVVVSADITRLMNAQTEIQELTERLQRLTNALRNLEIANERLAESNRQLHANNEELVISNEEFQASAEEVETLNEELQATNEELETLNEELQATIEELNTTNEDLQARSRELEMIAQEREQQRQRAIAQQVRLEAVLASMTDAVMLVDETGKPIITNAAFEETFESDGSRLRPHDLEGNALDEVDWPQNRAARGESFTLEFLLFDEHGSCRRFEATGRPVGEVTDVQGGVVFYRELTAEDENSSRTSAGSR